MPNIILNGSPLKTQCSQLLELLSNLQLVSNQVAVAINHTVIPSSEYADQAISDGDQIEIIHAVCGG